MIKVYLHGELGNQMFQWATGVALARKNNTPVVFQTTHAVEFRMSEFEISKEHPVLQPSMIEALLLTFMRLSIWAKLGRPLINGFRESGSNYQDLEFRKGRRYFGYFQSWRHFQSVRSELMSGFQLKEPSAAFHEMLQSLPKHFTGIHIRRGGGGKAVLAAEFHGILDLDYYRNAIKLSSSLGGPSEYVIFTDNLDKARDFIGPLGLEKVRIISPADGLSQCENLLLMSKSHNLIGANSSYSWWAAYLSTEQQIPPIFPRQWYMDPNISTNDMLPPEWISVGFEKFKNEQVVRGVRLD